MNQAASASSPALVDDIPQWALDMCHGQQWNMYILSVTTHNTGITVREHAEWSLPRVLNSNSHYLKCRLWPLPLPFPRLVVPTTPAPPVPGAAPNPPPALAMDYAAVPVPAAHPLLPATVGALRDLGDRDLATHPELHALLDAYNLPRPGPNDPDVDIYAQTVVFAEFIGVRL
ncbi:hypothetical protein DFH06DRAFT_1293115 [Mycena polygramma]|nr:hypothetical protein DFH06DRAFT_1293115 [Mycena polygramma]